MKLSAIIKKYNKVNHSVSITQKKLNDFEARIFYIENRKRRSKTVHWKSLDIDVPVAYYTYVKYGVSAGLYYYYQKWKNGFYVNIYLKRKL